MLSEFLVGLVIAVGINVWLQKLEARAKWAAWTEDWL